MFRLARAVATCPQSGAWGSPVRSRRVLLPLVTLLATLALGCPLAAWAPVRAYAQPAVAHMPLPKSAHRYELKAKLDPTAKSVTGTARITFTNTSERPLEALLFHLYMNAFRDRDSVFMRESGGSLRGAGVRGAGLIRLSSLRIAGIDVLAKCERELVSGDFTQLRAPLATPLAPGEQLAIEATFVVLLPPVFARSGYARDFFAVAQWFPKLAKLEPDGHFASFPFHALGEFYADFADYTLEVETPADLAVLASGVLLDETRDDKRIVRRFRADHVHDLAFVAARGFRSEVESVEGVLVRTLAPPGYESATKLHASVVRAGLRHFGRAFGAYPYPSLSVVIPPRDAPGASGMEYPTLIFTSNEWLTLPDLPSLSGAVVTAHELAHQWFYGLIANDELTHPVLDEGLTEWASLDLMRSMFGAAEGVPFVRFDRFEIARLLSTQLARSTAPGMAAYAYAPSEYAASVYERAALALESIRRAHGQKRFQHALTIYATGQRFRHPGPHELEQAFDAAYGAGFSAHTLTPLLFDGDTSAVHLGHARSMRTDDGYVTEVRARRSGKVSLPTWLALYSPYGKELRRVRFPARSAALDVTLETEERVARVVLDPDRALLLDDNLDDQVAQFTEPGSLSVIAQGLGWVQWLLAVVGP